MIGIICAMKIELEKIKENATDCKTVHSGSFEYTTGMIYGKHIVMCVCGVGKVYAALCAHTMIMSFSPDLIINVGVAGNLSKELNIGDIAIADSLVQHDMDTTALGDPPGFISGIDKVYFDTDKKAVKTIGDICKELGVKYLAGTIATGDKFIADMKDKDRIVACFNAIACDMEGAAIAQACYIGNTLFAAIRAISDDADGKSPRDFGEFCRISAHNCANVVKEFIEKY